MNNGSNMENAQNIEGNSVPKKFGWRIALMVIFMVVGLILAKFLGENSPWLLGLGALVTLVGLGVGNLFQKDASKHYTEGTLLGAAYASALTLGIACTQIGALLPLPFWME